MPANPPTLTADQLDLYLQRIKYANNATPRIENLQKSIEKTPLAALTELQRRHLGSIPWGNSALHYSNHHSISLHPTCIFQKLVGRRLDGYCMENTNLFYMVLSSLGYQVYPAGGRVSRAVVTGNPSEEGYVCL
jgi:arylamine N-acetyltransferase